MREVFEAGFITKTGLDYCRKLYSAKNRESAVAVFYKTVLNFMPLNKIGVYFFENGGQILESSFSLMGYDGNIIRGLPSCLNYGGIDGLFSVDKIRMVETDGLIDCAADKDKFDYVIPLVLSESKKAAVTLSLDKALKPSVSTEVRNIITQSAYYLALKFINIDNSDEMSRKDTVINETKEYVSNILENMVHGVISLDSNGIITTFSKGAEILLELNAKDVISKHYYNVFHPRISSLIDEVKQRLTSEKYIVESEAEYIMQGKFHIPIKFTASLIKGKTDKDAGLILVCKDSSSVKRLIALQELRNIRSEFLSTASHEFKTPLNLIMGSVGILNDGMVGDMNDQQKRLVSLVKEGGSRLHKLIKDLLDISRMDNDKSESVQVVNIRKLLDDCLVVQSESASRKNISVNLNVADDHISVKGVYSDVYKVFDNLISNAIKYTLNGGSVSVDVNLIQTETFPESFYKFSDHYKLKVVENAVEVTVSDTGIGIADGDIGIIFDEFKRCDNPYVRQTEGTGLGLFITKKIVESMGGVISVESQIGKGSRFCVRFPVATYDESVDNNKITRSCL